MTVTVTGDEVDEGNETLTVTLSSPSDGLSIGNATATGTITDDDDRGLVFTPTSVTVTEAAGDEPHGDLHGGAVVSADGGGVGGGGDGRRDGGDGAARDGELHDVELVDGQDGDGDGGGRRPRQHAGPRHRDRAHGERWRLRLGDRKVPVTVTDDEGSSSFSIGDASVTEGDSGTADLSFTVTLSPAADMPTTVAWATSKETADTATPGTDYTAGSGTLSFAKGDTSKTVTVKVTGDEVDESNETLTVTLSSASDGLSIGDATATGTITDDDTVGLVFTPDKVTVTEAAGTTRTATYTVALATQPTGAVSVAVATADAGAATVLPATVSFTTSNWSTGKTVTVTGVDDALDNTPDRATEIGHTASGGDYGSVTGKVPVTVTDDEGSSSFSIGDASVTEGDSGTADR